MKLGLVLVLAGHFRPGDGDLSYLALVHIRQELGKIDLLGLSPGATRLNHLPQKHTRQDDDQPEHHRFDG